MWAWLNSKHGNLVESQKTKIAEKIIESLTREQVAHFRSEYDKIGDEKRAVLSLHSKAIDAWMDKKIDLSELIKAAKEKGDESKVSSLMSKYEKMKKDRQKFEDEKDRECAKIDAKKEIINKRLNEL